MFTKRSVMRLALLLSLLLAAPLSAQSVSPPIGQARSEQLRQWLRQYPQADANRDGELTVEEAERYRRKLAGDKARSDGQSVFNRPHRSHDRVEPVVPHEPVEYQIEIFAVGHVFRHGHKLALVITRPPADDPIGATKSGSPSYRYDSHPPPATVTILHDTAHPSSLLLPALPEPPPLADPPVPIDQQAGLQPVGAPGVVH